MSRSCTTFFAAGCLMLLASTGAALAQSTDADRIAEALAAAPEEISSQATVLDWPASEGGEFRVLRQGSNGWTCLPDLPGDDNFEPMCNDAHWMSWVKAFASGQEPRVTGVGISYMLSSRWATSNIDPTATAPSADNEWVEGGAHLMMVVPDPAMLDGYPDDPGPGPYVMWKGTPLVHLMVPMETLARAPGG